MSTLLKTAAVGAAILLCSSSANAAMWGDRAYLDVNLGHGKVDTTKTGAGKNTAFIGGFAVGWKYTEGLGLEVGYDKFGNISKLNSSNYNYHIALKGMQPINEKMNVYGKVGFAFARSTCDAVGGRCDTTGEEKKTVTYFGAGLGYELTPTIDATAGFSMASSSADMPAMSAFTLGLSLSF